MGPLSLKQAREDAKFQMEQQRKDAELQQKLTHKEQLQQIKLAEMAQVGQLKVASKAKQSELPVPKLPQTAPTMMTNPEAGSSDTVPAMLTPGEAVIPQPAAQNPQNKPIIEALVNEGRKANRGLSDGAVDLEGYSMGSVKIKKSKAIPKPIGGKGTHKKVLPKLPKVDMRGFANGTPAVPAMGYQQGTPRVPLFDDSLLGHMIMQESSGHHRVPEGRANAGQLTTSPLKNDPAKGILQWRGSSAANPGYGVKPFDVNTADEHTQINASRDYMTGLTQEFGSVDKALAAYNWGPGNMRRHLRQAEESGRDWREGLPKETDNYVSKIYGNYTQGLAGQDTAEVPPTENTDAQVPPLATPAAPTRPTINDGEYNYSMSNEFAGMEEAPVTSEPFVPPPQTPMSAEEAWAASNDFAGVEGGPVAIPPEVPPVESPVNSPDDADDDGKMNAALEQNPEIEPQVRAVEQAAEDPVIQDQLVQAINEAQNLSEAERPAFLERMAKEIWGPTGLFSDRELARFAVTLVGGLLTGGSIRGSLRWSGLDAFQAGVKRQDGVFAAQAEQRKDMREHLQSTEKEVTKAFPTATKESRAAAQPYLDAAAEAMRKGRPDLAQQALAKAHMELMRNNRGSEGGKPSQPKKGFVPDQFGRLMPVDYRDNNGVSEVSTDGGQNWQAANMRVVDRSEYETNRAKVVEGSTVRAEAILDRLYGKDKSYNAKAEAAVIGQNAAVLFNQLGGSMDPYDFGKAYEYAFQMAEEQAKLDGKKVNSDYITKAFYGAAVMELRPSSSALYRVEGKKGSEKPSTDSLRAMGERTNELYRARRASDPNYSFGQAAKDIEDDYKKWAEKADKRSIEDYKEAAKVRNTTPFLLWVQMNGADKPF
jgi:hypothetical protein